MRAAPNFHLAAGRYFARPWVRLAVPIICLNGMSIVQDVALQPLGRVIVYPSKSLAFVSINVLFGLARAAACVPSRCRRQRPGF